MQGSVRIGRIVHGTGKHDIAIAGVDRGIVPIVGIDSIGYHRCADISDGQCIAIPAGSEDEVSSSPYHAAFESPHIEIACQQPRPLRPSDMSQLPANSQRRGIAHVRNQGHAV